MGFEPTRHLCPLVFKTSSIGRSDNPPDRNFCRPGASLAEFYSPASTWAGAGSVFRAAASPPRSTSAVISPRRPSPRPAPVPWPPRVRRRCGPSRTCRCRCVRPGDEHPRSIETEFVPHTLQGRALVDALRSDVQPGRPPDRIGDLVEAGVGDEPMEVVLVVSGRDDDDSGDGRAPSSSKSTWRPPSRVQSSSCSVNRRWPEPSSTMYRASGSRSRNRASTGVGSKVSTCQRSQSSPSRRIVTAPLEQTT